jgi:hypothetical protein
MQIANQYAYIYIQIPDSSIHIFDIYIYIYLCKILRYLNINIRHTAQHSFSEYKNNITPCELI